MVAELDPTCIYLVCNIARAGKHEDRVTSQGHPEHTGFLCGSSLENSAITSLLGQAGKSLTVCNGLHRTTW